MMSIKLSSEPGFGFTWHDTNGWVFTFRTAYDCIYGSRDRCSAIDDGVEGVADNNGVVG